MTQKRPYWEHPDFNEEKDPSYETYLLSQILSPIMDNLACEPVRRCICDRGDFHDLEPIIYEFGKEGNHTELPFCPSKDFETGELLLMAQSPFPEGSSRVSLSKLSSNLFLLELGWSPYEPDWDSGDEAAWQGGNVDFGPPLTQEEISRAEERWKKELENQRLLDDKYEPFPFFRSIINAVYIKSDASKLAKSVYEYLQLEHPDLLKHLLANQVTNGTTEKFIHEDEFEFLLNSSLEPSFSQCFLDCLRGKNID